MAATASTPDVQVNTTVGSFTVELYPSHAPKTCQNFVELARRGYYDNTVFHRIIPDFMVQGGDPTGTGRGGESIYGGKFADEIRRELKHTGGARALPAPPRARIARIPPAMTCAVAPTTLPATAAHARRPPRRVVRSGDPIDGQRWAQHQWQPVLHHPRAMPTPRQQAHRLWAHQLGHAGGAAARGGANGRERPADRSRPHRERATIRCSCWHACHDGIAQPVRRDSTRHLHLPFGYIPTRDCRLTVCDRSANQT